MINDCWCQNCYYGDRASNEPEEELLAILTHTDLATGETYYWLYCRDCMEAR